MTLLERFLTDESGATAIEYSLVAILIAIPLIAGIEPIRDTVIGYYRSVENAFSINQ